MICAVVVLLVVFRLSILMFISVEFQIVDVATKSDCNNAFAYVPDLGAYGLVVYSFEENKSWRVKHNFFHFDPLNGEYNIGGVNFQWTDGIFGMGLGKTTPDG